jgi:hypothetical protein
MAIPDNWTLVEFPSGIVAVIAFVVVSITSTKDAHGCTAQPAAVIYTFLPSGLITTLSGLVPAGLVATTARLWVSTIQTDVFPSVL